MENDLKDLGLTWNEIKVYKSLLKLGETPVGGIINDLRIHRQIAYNALDALENKGMVERVKKNKFQHFKLSNPEKIIENVRKQEVIAKRLSLAVKNEMRKSRHEHEINIYNGQVGARQFYTHIFKTMPIGSKVYVMGVGIKQFSEALGNDFLNGTYNKLKNQRKIYSQLIVSNVMKKENDEFEKKVNPKLRSTRYLPYENLNPVTTSIFPDRVTFLSAQPEIFIIEIINQEFRESYKEHFNMLWKVAKK